jgi:hypothetical protein
MKFIIGGFKMDEQYIRILARYAYDDRVNNEDLEEAIGLIEYHFFNFNIPRDLLLQSITLLFYRFSEIEDTKGFLFLLYTIKADLY